MTTPAAAHFPVLGLDISERRIGIAMLSHPSTPPQPLYTYERRTRARDIAQCREWVQRYRVGAVVLGLPVNMDGSLGPHATWMTRFARELGDALEVPVMLQDERQTTVEAEEALLAQGLSKPERDERRDAVAAAIILSRWVEHIDDHT